jgi:hypothetical protein
MLVPLALSTVGFLTVLLDLGTLQTAKRTASASVGASMALLATLQDAGVLPPEGTPEANRTVQVVIQFQFVFMKSSDAAVEAFRSQALAARWPTNAQEVDARFRSGGWTTEVLEAFVEWYATLQVEQRAKLDGAFALANMRRTDFEYLSDLFLQARGLFSRRGLDIHEVFSAHRSTMPGKDRPKRKERYNGDQSVYLDQGKGGTDERRSSVSEETDRSRTGALLLRPAGYFRLHQRSG